MTCWRKTVPSKSNYYKPVGSINESTRKNGCKQVLKDKRVEKRNVPFFGAQTMYPPAHLLPVLAKTLGVSTDQLSGVEKVKRNGRVKDTKLWRRFSQVEKLPPVERKPIVQMIDAFFKAKQTESK